MKEESVKKRGWVKNAAIIFLAVMLVLTFFSNTIMNRSLPEVAVRYTTSGTINARIRGMGTVSANDSYEVVLNQTRTIKDVNVRLNREVEVGEVLFTLADAGSQELETARDALHTLLLDYEKAVIGASLNGNYAVEERGIELARTKLDEIQADRDEIPYSESEIELAQEEVATAETEVASAKLAVETAEERVSFAQEYYDERDEAVGIAKAGVTTAESAITSAQSAADASAAAVRTAQDALNAHSSGNAALARRYADKSTEVANKQNDIEVANVVHGDEYEEFKKSAAEYYASITSITSLEDDKEWDKLSETQKGVYYAAYAQYLQAENQGDPFSTETSIVNSELNAYYEITKLNGQLAALKLELERLGDDLAADRSSDTQEYNRLAGRLNEARAEQTAANRALSNARATLTSANAVLASANAVLANAKFMLDSALAVQKTAKAEQENANEMLEMAKKELETQQGYKTDWRAANDAIKSQQMSLEDLLFNFSEKQKTDGVTNALQALDMTERRNQISKKRAEIESLEDDDVEDVITSPVSGTIRQLNISPGNQTQPGSPLAVIEVADRGYTLSFPVTIEQSRKVAVGDIAEMDRWYWGGEVRAVLASIRNDPQNPATSRILEFDISGDVQSGTQLNLSIGERSANYDIIVPNSALRSDTNGDFVLIVLARSSPLGNRFIATRVDVQIIASDDTQSAVTGGGLSGWDYVITTSNRPLEPGMQVRMIDNP